jgi:uncharacterized protein YoxC
MSDDIFRMVVTAAVGLTFLVFVVQAFLIMGILRTVRALQGKIEPLAEKGGALVAKLNPIADSAGPDLKDIGPAIRKFREASEKIGPMLDRAGVVITKAGPAIEEAGKALANANRILEDVRPRIAEVSSDVVGITHLTREKVQQLGDVLVDAGERARARLEQIDTTVNSTVEQVEQVGDAMKRAVLRPVREVNGLAAGISAAVATLVKKPRKSSVDSATQDEEMFI